MGSLIIERKTFLASDRIFHQGDPATSAYLITEGQVEITMRKDDDVVVIGYAGKGEMLGEMALISSTPRSATARCTEETTVMVVPIEEFNKHLDNAEPVIQQLLKQLTRRLRNQSLSIVEKATVIR